MNKQKEPALERLSEAMEREGIFEIRRWDVTQPATFAVKMCDGRLGQGPTPQAAIDNAVHPRFEVAA